VLNKHSLKWIAHHYSPSYPSALPLSCIPFTLLVDLVDSNWLCMQSSPWGKRQRKNIFLPSASLSLFSLYTQVSQFCIVPTCRCAVRSKVKMNMGTLKIICLLFRPGKWGFVNGLLIPQSLYSPPLLNTEARGVYWPHTVLCFQQIITEHPISRPCGFYPWKYCCDRDSHSLQLYWAYW